MDLGWQRRNGPGSRKGQRTPRQGGTALESSEKQWFLFFWDRFATRHRPMTSLFDCHFLHLSRLRHDFFNDYEKANSAFSAHTRVGDGLPVEVCHGAGISCENHSHNDRVDIPVKPDGPRRFFSTLFRRAFVDPRSGKEGEEAELDPISGARSRRGVAVGRHRERTGAGEVARPRV